jgi:hypothetical protein
MDPKRGYYSLIQFCPDLSRLETVNVGVVLFCPEIRFIEARMSSNSDRARRLFGQDVQSDRLRHAKAAMEARFRSDRKSFREVADLERFAQTRANDLLMTPPRPIKVLTPEAEIEALFKEMVGGRSARHALTRHHPLLDETFHRLQGQRIK